MSASEVSPSGGGRETPPTVNWGRQIYFSMVAAIGLLALYPAYNHWRIDRYETLRRQISSAGGRAPRLRRAKTAEEVYWAALGGNMANVELRSVYFPQSASVPREALRRLRGCAELEELHLGGQELDLPMWRDLFTLRGLERLELRYCRLSDDELRGLERLDRLRKLDLRGTAVTDASLQRLASLQNLETLNLLHTNVSVAGAARLARQLPRAKIQHRPWPSGEYRLACQQLFRLGAVLEVSEDPARGDYVQLSRKNWRGTPRDVALIAELDLAILELNNLDLKPELLTSIARLPNLRNVAISNCGLRDVDFSPLGQAPALRSVALKHVIVERPVLEGLGHIRRLDSLALVSARLAPDSLASLPRFSCLRRLALVGTRLHEEGFCGLAEASSLRHLTLMRVALPETSLRRLEEVRHLETLSLRQIMAGDNCVPYLSRLVSLRRLETDKTSLSPASIQQLQNALPNCRVSAGEILRQQFDLVRFFEAHQGT